MPAVSMCLRALKEVHMKGLNGMRSKYSHKCFDPSFQDMKKLIRVLTHRETVTDLVSNALIDALHLHRICFTSLSPLSLHSRRGLHAALRPSEL